MCLAVPGRIEEMIDDRSAIVNFMGIKKKIALDLIEESVIGDYVIVHAGFAINKLNKEDFLETVEYLNKLRDALE